MVIDDKVFKKHTNNKFLIIDALIKIITKGDMLVNNTSYYYHNDELQEFIISLYLLKLLINDTEYLEKKRSDYLDIVKGRLSDGSNIKDLNISNITNIEAADEISLVLEIKRLLLNNKYLYVKNEDRIVFDNDMYIDAKWLLSYVALLFDRTSNNEGKKSINVCYTIPNQDIEKCTNLNNLDDFFSHFTFYKITVKGSDANKEIKDNSILVIKNAANNYLKHLKQFKYGLESEESYQIFYNLLKNECHKQKFILEEEVNVLSELDSNYLERIKSFINYNFLEFSINKQTKTIENIIWQLSNNLTILEHVNSYLDSVSQLCCLLNERDNNITYNDLKWENKLHDIQILLMLIILKFMITYIHEEDIDYSLLDFSNIKPAYMNIIDNEDELQIKRDIQRLREEIRDKNEELDEFKFERQSLSKDELSQDEYRKELEMCVSNINRISIDISNLEAGITNYKKELENIKFEKKIKYRDLDSYNYNRSIIRHMVSSIYHSGFYLKTNNNNDLLENVIIIEDYVKTDNAFYLEVSFKELLKISNLKVIEGVEEQSDLPKLK